MWMPEFEGDQRTIGYVLDDRVNKYPERVFGYITGEKITFAQLGERVNRVANSLLDLGVRKGDVVSIMMSNCPEFVYTWFALAKIGAAEAVINTAFKGNILEYFINYGGAKIVVLDEDLVPRIGAIQDSLNEVERLVVRKVPIEGNSIPKTKFETIPIEHVMSSPATSPKVEGPHYTDLAALMYTSGTTGASKGVMCSHNHCLTAAEDYVQCLRLTPQDKIYNCFPMFHMNAQFLGLLSALTLGTTCVLAERFSASRFWDELRKYEITAFNFLGSMIRILWNEAPKSNDADNPARVGFGVPVPAELERPFQERFGIKLIQCFGATESNIVTATPWDEEAPIGSCGKPLPYFDVRLVDDNDNEVPTGAIGEFVSRPKRPFTMMSGYLKMPESTVQATRNLWYHFGDYGRKDENGFFYFIDRKKDSIRRRGENVSSTEIEAIVNSYPGVLESAASGVWAEVGDEEIKISICLREGACLDPLDLMRFCEARLPVFAVPRYVEFRNDFPRTSNGKIAKYKIKGEGIHPNLWDREASGYKLAKR